MAQQTYGSITITDLTDITNVFLQYGKANSSATVTNDYTFSGTGEVGWFTAATGTVDANTIYFQLINGVYKVVLNPSSTTGLYVSSPYPTWSSGFQIWIRQVTIKEGIDEPEYGTPYLDTAVNQINNTINIINSDLSDLTQRTGHFWTNEEVRRNGQTYDGVVWTKPDYLAGTYLAQGLSNFAYNDATTYGYNTFYGNGIVLRYNQYPLTVMNHEGIQINAPILDNNNKINGSTKGTVIDSTGMEIFKYDATANNGNGADISVAKFGSIITLGNSESINNKFNIKITNTTDTEDEWGNRGPGILLRKGTTVVNEITENGMKIYGLYISSGSQVYDFGQLANFGSETKIGATNYTKINENQIGFYKENNICLGKIDFTEAIKNDCIYNFSHSWADKTQLTDIYTETISSYDGLGVTRVAGKFQYILSPAGFGEGEFDFDITQSKVNTYTIGNWFTMNIGVLSESTVAGSSLNQEVGYSATTNNIFSHFKINFVVYYDTYSQGPHYIFGKDVDSIGQYSFAMGNNTIAREDCQLAIGNFNIPIDDAAFVIGNGTDNNNRSNSFVIYNNGNLEVPNDFKIINHENIDNYLQLNSTGLAVFQRDDTIHPVTTLGSDVYIGKTNSSYLHVNENGLYIKDSGIPIFQIITEKIINGPIIDVVLYDNYTSSQLIGYNYSNIDYTYSPKETKIYFNDGGLQDNASFVIDFTYKGIAEKYNSNQNKYQYTSVRDNIHTSFNYTANKGELQYYNIIYALDGYNSTLGRVQYYGGNEIIFQNYNNHYNPRSSTSLTIEYYQNIKITSNQQLANVPTITIGPQELSHAEIDYHSLQMIDKEQNVYFYISDLRDKDGYGTVTDHFTGDGDTIYFPFSSTPASSVSVKVGGVTKVYETDYIYNRDRGVTFVTAPSNGLSVIINYKTTDSTLKAFTFGIREPDYGLGKYSVVEGYYCIASGIYSYATGLWTEATARCAHAEGAVTVANGAYSHAQNECTIASKTSQTVLGSFNVEDTATITTHPSGTISYGQYAIIVGNGTTSSARSNALTVDWRGNVEAAGNITGINVNASNLIASNSIQVPKGKNIYLEDDNYINKFYCGTGGGTDNIYYKTNGYHAFFTANSTGRFYIQDAQVNSNVPYKAGGVKLFTIGWTTEVDNAQIAANGYADYKITVPSKSNYTPIAVVGYYFANATTNGANSSSISCNMAYYVSAENKARLMCRNHASSAARVRYAAAILYVATTQGI